MTNTDSPSLFLFETTPEERLCDTFNILVVSTGMEPLALLGMLSAFGVSRDTVDLLVDFADEDYDLLAPPVVIVEEEPEVRYAVCLACDLDVEVWADGDAIDRGGRRSCGYSSSGRHLPSLPS